MTRSHPIPDAALESDIAILGKKGRGKTYAAKGCVERLLDIGRRVVVLDPLSTWWGLKAGPKGFPIAVLGGPHGDLPLADTDGAALGRFLATAQQSAVLDLGQMRKAEMMRFATPFLEELYTANRDPLWLVLEEADVFAPQNPGADTARLYGEVDRIARRGRQYGFRLITLTQRPARLAKDVLTQLSTLVALGLTSPQDRDAIKAWVEGNADRDAAKAVVDSLASLRVGEGWVWAPDLGILERVTFPKIRTPDTSATPKAGEARPTADISLAVDVAAIRTALSLSAASSVGAKPDTATSRPSADELTAAEESGYDRGVRDSSAWIGPQLQAFADAARDLTRRIEAEISIVTARWSGAPLPSIEPGRVQPPKRDVDPTPTTEVSVASLARDGIPPARRRILDAIAWANATGQDEPSREMIAFLARVSWKSGGYRNNLSALSAAGLIRYPGKGTLVLTRAGRATATAPAESLTHAAMLDRVGAVIAPACMRVLEAVLVTYPASAKREDVARAASVSATSGGFRNNLSRLSSLGLITYPAAGEVRAADVLFPRGRNERAVA